MWDPPRSEIESMSPALAGDSLPLSHQGSSSLAEYMKSHQDDGKGVMFSSSALLADLEKEGKS